MPGDALPGKDDAMADQDVTVAELRKLMADFVAEREWHCYHDAKNLSMALAIEGAELMEHFQWVRNEELEAHLAGERVRAEVTEEVADVACYLLALANVLELDLSEAVAAKMAKNAAKYPAEEFRGRYFKPGA
jgi:NTP pyrophosphatase (non-canonical NTP hydrolase)